MATAAFSLRLPDGVAGAVPLYGGDARGSLGAGEVGGGVVAVVQSAQGDADEFVADVSLIRNGILPDFCGDGDAAAGRCCRESGTLARLLYGKAGTEEVVVVGVDVVDDGAVRLGQVSHGGTGSFYHVTGDGDLVGAVVRNPAVHGCQDAGLDEELRQVPTGGFTGVDEVVDAQLTVRGGGVSGAGGFQYVRIKVLFAACNGHVELELPDGADGDEVVAGVFSGDVADAGVRSGGELPELAAYDGVVHIAIKTPAAHGQPGGVGAYLVLQSHVAGVETEVAPGRVEVVGDFLRACPHEAGANLVDVTELVYHAPAGGAEGVRVDEGADAGVHKGGSHAVCVHESAPLYAPVDVVTGVVSVLFPSHQLVLVADNFVIECQQFRSALRAVFTEGIHVECQLGAFAHHVQDIAWGMCQQMFPVSNGISAAEDAVDRSAGDADACRRSAFGRGVTVVDVAESLCRGGDAVGSRCEGVLTVFSAFFKIVDDEFNRGARCAEQFHVQAFSCLDIDAGGVFKGGIVADAEFFTDICQRSVGGVILHAEGGLFRDTAACSGICRCEVLRQQQCAVKGAEGESGQEEGFHTSVMLKRGIILHRRRGGVRRFPECPLSRQRAAAVLFQTPGG